jgi:hypothetical protein
MIGVRYTDDSVLTGDVDAAVSTVSSDSKSTAARDHDARRSAPREPRDAAGRRSLTGIEFRRQRSIHS